MTQQPKAKALPEESQSTHTHSGYISLQVHALVNIRVYVYYVCVFLKRLCVCLSEVCMGLEP